MATRTSLQSHNPIPVSLREQLRTIYFACRSPVAGKRLWDCYLTFADRRKLGGDFAHAWTVHRDAIGIWAAVQGKGYDRAILEVGRCLGFLPQQDFEVLLELMGEASTTRLDAATVQNIASRYPLVLVEHPRQLFWRGVQVPINWMRRNALWNYFYELARARKSGTIFDRFSLPGEDVYSTSKKKSRLSLLTGFPGDLADCICAAGQRTQMLDIAPEDIHFIEALDGE